MNWSNIDDEWIFTNKTERERHSCNWKIELRDDRTGDITMEDLGDKENTYIKIYDWEPVTLEHGKAIAAEGVQLFNGEKLTVIIQKLENEQHMIAVMMPDSRIALFFDSIIQN